MDKAAATGERLSYARCFVEINASKKLPKTVSIEITEGVYFDVPVEFEWVPPICKKCSTFGPQEIHSPTIQTWIPKEKQQVRIQSHIASS